MKKSCDRCKYKYFGTHEMKNVFIKLLLTENLLNNLNCKLISKSDSTTECLVCLHELNTTGCRCPLKNVIIRINVRNLSHYSVDIIWPNYEKFKN